MWLPGYHLLGISLLRYPSAINCYIVSEGNSPGFVVRDAHGKHTIHCQWWKNPADSIQLPNKWWASYFIGSEDIVNNIIIIEDMNASCGVLYMGGLVNDCFMVFT